MVVSDLILIAPESKYLELRTGDLTFDRYNRTFVFAPKIYKTGFRRIQSFRGIWYVLHPPKQHLYTDTFFDLNCIDGINHIIVRDRWRQTVDELIQDFKRATNGGSFGFMARLDCPSTEVIHRKCDLSAFLHDLSCGMIHFDELYMFD